MSTLSSYCVRFQISGAMYSGVPTAVIVALVSLKRLRPKSLPGTGAFGRYWGARSI